MENGERQGRDLNKIWKPVPGYEGLYEVSEDGEVYGLVRGAILRPGVQTRGYEFVNLSKDGVHKSTTVHKIVAAAFIGPRPDGAVVMHYNDEKRDNHFSNLRYGSQKENMEDMKRNKGYSGKKPGAGHRMTQDERERALQLSDDGFTWERIAELLGRDSYTIARNVKDMRREREQVKAAA